MANESSFQSQSRELPLIDIRKLGLFEPVVNEGVDQSDFDCLIGILDEDSAVKSVVGVYTALPEGIGVVRPFTKPRRLSEEGFLWQRMDKFAPPPAPRTDHDVTSAKAQSNSLSILRLAQHPTMEAGMSGKQWSELALYEQALLEQTAELDDSDFGVLVAATLGRILEPVVYYSGPTNTEGFKPISRAPHVGSIIVKRAYFPKNANSGFSVTDTKPLIEIKPSVHTLQAAGATVYDLDRFGQSSPDFQQLKHHIGIATVEAALAYGLRAGQTSSMVARV